MALGQQQQEELSICCRDVKHKIFVFLLKEEQPFFICLSVHPCWPHRERLQHLRGPCGNCALGFAEIWTLHPSGSHPQAEQSHSQARPVVSAAGTPQHPRALLVMERCNLCQLRMCPGLNLDKYLFTLRCRRRRGTSLLSSQSRLQSHMHTGT